jgi:hypothetical protein
MRAELGANLGRYSRRENADECLIDCKVSMLHFAHQGSGANAPSEMAVRLFRDENN